MTYAWQKEGREPVGPIERYEAGKITKEEALATYDRGLITKSEYLKLAGLEDVSLGKEKRKMHSLAEKGRFVELVHYVRELAPRMENRRMADRIEDMAWDCRQLRRDPGPASLDYQDSFEGLLEYIGEAESAPPKVRRREGERPRPPSLSESLEGAKERPVRSGDLVVVREHERGVPSGGTTTVREHTRRLP